jgi:opacity protein-like surface antigen
MKKFLAALALPVLLASVAATSSHAAVVTRSTFHSDFIYFNPCTGEDVHIVGDVTFSTTSTVTDNTISGTMHSVFIATGTGLTSGLTYQETVVFNRSFQTSLQNGEATNTMQGVISVIAPGGGNNQYDPIFLHTTIDANGNVTSSRFEFPGVSCR